MSLARPNSRRHYTLPGEFLSIPERGRINAFFKLKILFKPWLPLCSRRRRSAPENYFPQYRRLSRSSRACLSSFFLPPLPSPPRPSYFISENRDFEEKTIEETWKWKIFQNFLLKYILTRLKIDVVNSQLFLQFRFDNRRCIIRTFENRKNYLHLTIESWITQLLSRYTRIRNYISKLNCYEK